LSYDVVDIAKARYPDCKFLCFDQRNIKAKIEELFLEKKLEINEEYIRDGCQIRHTPHLMIQVALLLGYTRIYLFGLDHSYVRDRFNNINYQPHFYDEFDEIIEKTGDMTQRSLTELFLDSHLTFKVYRAQNQIANSLGVKIYDCTADGCLDMFEKRLI
jgi:hypothetical protein